MDHFPLSTSPEITPPRGWADSTHSPLCGLRSLCPHCPSTHHAGLQLLVHLLLPRAHSMVSQPVFYSSPYILPLPYPVWGSLFLSLPSSRVNRRQLQEVRRWEESTWVGLCLP